MKRKLSCFLLVTSSFAFLASTLCFSSPLMVNASETIDYSSSKWVDMSPNHLWSVDEPNKRFEFNKTNIDESDFTANCLVTDQFDTRGSNVTIEATIVATTSSDEITSGKVDEVNIGISPWYYDAQNWILVYAKFARETDEDLKIRNGHITEVQCYAKIDGSPYVSYYCLGDGNEWISEEDPACSEWHGMWPDAINDGLSPTTLQDCQLDASDELTFKVRKTRKEFAGKKCDSIYATINGYTLNFGSDKFMFSQTVEKEAELSSKNPKIGFYAMSSKYTVVKDIKVDISKEETLPLPVVEPSSTPTKSGKINKTVKIPDFVAYDNNGATIAYDVAVFDPSGKTVEVDTTSCFIPTSVGLYKVVVSATDEKKYTGTYIYEVNVKQGTNHIDGDVYNDVYTRFEVDYSIYVAWGIFIAVPVLVAAYVTFKVIRAKRSKDTEGKSNED